jgi:hypothetical protein
MVTLLRAALPYLLMGGVALGGWGYIKHLQGEVSEAKQEARTQRIQAGLNLLVTRSVERYFREVRVLETKAQEAKDAIEKAPGAGDDFAVRDELCNQLARLRDGEPACVSSDPPDLPGSVRPSEGEPPY